MIPIDCSRLESDFLLSAAQYAFLPALTIIIGSLSGWMLGMRNRWLRRFQKIMS